MIKNNKLSLVFSSVAILLPVAVGLIFWDKLPETMAMHWNIAGEADGHGGKAFIVFGMPLIIFALHWLCVFFTEKDKKNQNQSPKMQKIVLWICPVLLWVVSGAIYCAALGMQFNMMAVVCVLLGVMFCVLGNYLPKCKQNNTLGIKIKWTLENEENWNKTHRLGGILWFVCGLVMIAAVFLPQKISVPLMAADIVIAVIVPTVYSYSLYRKMLKSGELSVEEIKPFGGYNKTLVIVSVVFLVALLVFALIIMPNTGDIEITCGSTSVEIKADYWSDISVDYADIDKIELRNDVESGVRTNGFGTPRLMLGTFENEEFGIYTRYTYGKCDLCVVIEDDGNILVVNGADDAATQILYNELLSKIN